LYCRCLVFIHNHFTNTKMLRNFLNIAFRHYSKNKLSFFISITGFAIGLACAFLVFIYLYYEFSYESVFKDQDRSYRLGVTSKMEERSTEFATMLPAVGPALKNALPDLEEVVRVVNDHPKSYIRETSSAQNMRAENMLLAESNFFSLFDFKIKQGSLSNFSEPGMIVLTEALSERLFGNSSPVGKIVIMNENTTKPLTVVAVIERPANNTHLKFDGLISWKTSLGNETVWDDAYAYTYIKLTAGSDIKIVSRKIIEYIANNPFIKKVEKSLNTTLVVDIMPIKDIHLYSHRFNELSDSNNPDLLYMLLTIGIFFVVCSAFNYINLAVADSMLRMKEVGMRKVFGAQPDQIRSQFFIESLVVVIISVLMAFLVSVVLLGKFSELVGQELKIGLLVQWKLIVIFLLIILIVALVSGGYPSFYISRLSPANVFSRKRQMPKVGKMTVRKLLVVLQFVISTTVIACTIIVVQQLSFVSNVDIGFDKDKIIYFDVPGKQASDFLKQQLSSDLRVKSVASSSYSPQEALNDEYSIELEDGAAKVFNVGRMFIDYSFLDLMGMKVEKGRNFSPEFGADSSSTFIVNEALVNFARWKNPIGKQISAVNFEKSGSVIGVVKDASLFSLHRKNAPMVISLNTIPNADAQYFFLKYNTSNVNELIEKIRGYFKQNFGGLPFDYSFLDQSYDRLYKSDERYKKVVLIGSFVMIFISCLGLYGLSSFVAEKRKGEIGLRKVLGASVGNIAKLHMTEFFWLALIGGAIAWPISYYASWKWLQTFTIRVDIDPVVLILSTMLTILAVIATTAYHSIRLAKINPVDTIRDAA